MRNKKISLINSIFILNISIIFIGVLDLILIVIDQRTLFDDNFLYFLIIGYPTFGIYQLNISYILLEDFKEERRKIIYSSWFITLFPILSAIIYRFFS